MEKPSYKDFCFAGNGSFDLASLPTNLQVPESCKDKIVKEMKKNIKKIAKLQDKLYADRREGVVVLIQAMDAAGKDGTVKHVFSGVNPQGV